MIQVFVENPVTLAPSDLRMKSLSDPVNWSSILSKTLLSTYVSVEPSGIPVLMNARALNVEVVVKPVGPLAPLGAPAKLIVSLTTW